MKLTAGIGNEYQALLSKNLLHDKISK